MKRLLTASVLAFSLIPFSRAFAQRADSSDSQSVKNHVITVSRGGDAYGKPDLGILVMSLRSSGPIAEEAVADNAKKDQAAQSALADLGFDSTSYKISSVTFGEAGGGRFGMASPGIVAYQAEQFVYVFFNADELADVAKLTGRLAAVIEALRKAGAVPANVVASRMQGQDSLILYTIKDSSPYEHQALKQAIARAREAAEDVAAGMGVQITGLRNVSTGYLMGNLGAGSVAIEGLSYRFYSTKSDEVRIRANATVEYDFK